MDIYINKDGQQYGPYTLDQVNEYLAQGSFQATDPAWRDGLANWCPLNQIAGVVDPSSPTPPSFDPTTYNPNAAPPPAVASPSPTEAPVTAASVTCPGCQASVAPEMLFCATCGYDLQAGWQDKMTSYPAEMPQVEYAADPRMIKTGASSPKRLPAPVSSIIIAVVGGLLCLGLLVFGVISFGAGFSKGLNYYAVGMGVVFILLGVAGAGQSIRALVGSRLCSECKRRITKNDATCPGCKAMFERPT